jgi:hypothetical protein
MATHDGAGTAQGSALHYATAGGLVAGERSITDSVCYCCKTALAVGPGGTLFAAWRHVYPGNMRDIAMAVARGDAESFSPPARVSEDGWSIDGCPDDGPSIALGGGGTVHVVWPTVIPGQTPEAALFYASTRDGVHFIRRRRIPISVIRLSDGFHVTACAAAGARGSAATRRPGPQRRPAWETADNQTRPACAGGAESGGRCDRGRAPHRAAPS